MRRSLTLSTLMLVAVLVVVPVLVVLPTAAGRLSGREPAPPKVVDGSDSLAIMIYLPETRRIQEMPLGEYLKGVVAAEMPAEFEEEALKAQFVVARTFAVRRMRQFNGGKGGCSLNEAADVCADVRTGQAYTTREALVRKMGDRAAEAYWARLGAIQAATAGQILRYRGQLVDPLYHSVSGTYTEDAAEYFSQSLPYLKPVDDSWGKDSPKLLETRTFSSEELARKLTVQGKPISVPAIANQTRAGKIPVQVLTQTASKRVKTVRVGDIVMTGREFRERLDLRSTNFTVNVKDGKVVVNTVGNGHGVGMSQYGANGMARAGKSYRDILLYYYQGVTLSRIFGD